MSSESVEGRIRRRRRHLPFLAHLGGMCNVADCRNPPEPTQEPTLHVAKFLRFRLNETLNSHTALLIWLAFGTRLEPTQEPTQNQGPLRQNATWQLPPRLLL